MFMFWAPRENSYSVHQSVFAPDNWSNIMSLYSYVINGLFLASFVVNVRMCDALKNACSYSSATLYKSLNAHHTRILIDFFLRAGEKYLKSAIVSKRLEQSIGNWLSLSCLFGSWSSFVFEMGSKLQEKLSILQVCKVVISTMYNNFYKCLTI